MVLRALWVFGLAFGVGMGLSVAMTGAPELAVPNGAQHEMDHSAHQSADLPACALDPALSIGVAAVPDAGWLVTLDLDNFELRPVPEEGSRFSPLALDGVTAAGHAHLFVNGVKAGRLFSRSALLDPAWIKPGVNQISVQLNSDAHDQWLHQGRAIVATVFFNPEADVPVLHQFASFPSH